MQAPHSLGWSFQWGSLSAQNPPFWMGFAGHTDDQHPKRLTDACLTGTHEDRLWAQPTGLREGTLALLRCGPWAGTRACGQSWPPSPGLACGGLKPLPPLFVASLAPWELFSWHRFSHSAEGQAESKDECSFPSTLSPGLKQPIPPRLMPDSLGVSGLP